MGHGVEQRGRMKRPDRRGSGKSSASLLRWRRVCAGTGQGFATRDRGAGKPEGVIP